MEWKEHIAWIAPYLATVVAFGAVYYGRRLAYEPAVRRLLMWVFVAAFDRPVSPASLGRSSRRLLRSSRGHHVRKRGRQHANTERVDIVRDRARRPRWGRSDSGEADGPLAAVLVAAGIGSFALGLFTTLAEASEAFRERLILNEAVGPLSGKTVWATVAS